MRKGATSALAISSLLVVGSGAASSSAEPKPRRIDLTERVRGALSQIDVTVRGRLDIISTLGVEDFELQIGGHQVDQFIVDSLCQTTANERATTGALESGTSTSYLFYFDQHHLTLSGRQNSIDLARIMIPAVVQGGNRVAIISAGQTLRAFASWTDDDQELLGALNRLEDDRTQWDTYPSLEQGRHADLQRATSTSARCALAGTLQREEIWRTERALHLFSVVLHRFADLDAPKVAIYFADTARIRAGAHYYFGADFQCDESAFDAQTAFDRVIDQASALGVRIYAVQAQGLVGLELFSRAPRVAQDRAVRDAQSGLKTLGLETGGDAFLNGVPARKIVDRIRDDHACVYLISFDPEGMPHDEALPVRVDVKRPGVRIQARGRTIIPSESARQTSRLLAAFGSPDSVRRDVPLHGGLIPLGFEDGWFTALVQIQVPSLAVDRVVWDLGGSLVSRGEVRAESSLRVSIARRGVPVVMETPMRFRPGPFELTLVARETTTDQLGTLRLEGMWPEKTDVVSVSEIALVQTRPGAFVQREEVRTGGGLALPATEVVWVDTSCTFIALVCRGGKKVDSLRVQRDVTGDTQASFPDLNLSLEDSPCVQVRDSIPGGTLTHGVFSYAIRVVRGDKEVATRHRDFNASRVNRTSDPGTAR